MAKNITVKDEYQKELNRIKRFVKSAHKRGYRFETDPLPKEPKNITKKSVERLRKITTKSLYAKTTYYDPILQQRISGSEEQRLVKSRAAKSAAVAKTKAHYPKYRGEEVPRTKSAPSYPTVDTGNEDKPNSPPRATSAVAAYIENLIVSWEPNSNWSDSFTEVKRKDKNALARIWHNALDTANENGTTAQLFEHLEANAEEIKRLTWKIIYGNSGAAKDEDYITDITAFAAIIQGAPLDIKSAINLEDTEIGMLGYENQE